MIVPAESQTLAGKIWSEIKDFKASLRAAGDALSMLTGGVPARVARSASSFS